MTDPVAFAEARLDEDEAAARAAASNDPRARSWTDEEGGYPVAGPLVEDGWHVVVVPPGATWGQVRHIARHDPARALREAEAARRILERHRECAINSGYCRDRHVEPPPCPDLADLLSRWDDHPDYRPEWKP